MPATLQLFECDTGHHEEKSQSLSSRAKGGNIIAVAFPLPQHAFVRRDDLKVSLQFPLHVYLWRRLIGRLDNLRSPTVRFQYSRQFADCYACVVAECF